MSAPRGTTGWLLSGAISPVPKTRAMLTRAAAERFAAAWYAAWHLRDLERVLSHWSDRNHRGEECAELLVLGVDGLAHRGIAHYGMVAGISDP